MSNYYVSSVAYTAVTPWAALTVYTTGLYRRQLAAQTFGNERVFKCTTGGTSGATEPTWSRNTNATTTDGTAVWTCVSGAEAEQSAGNWTAPCAHLTAWNNQYTAASPGNTVFVSSDHVDSTTSASNSFTQTTNINVSFLSVSRTGSALPPTSTDFSAGAQFITAGAFDTIFRPDGYVYGFTISTGTGTSSQSHINIGAPNVATLDNCTFILNNTSTSSHISLLSGRAGRLHLINPKFKFGDTAQGLIPGGTSSGDIVIRGATAPIDLSGSMPTALFKNDANTTAGYMLCERCDFSSFTGTSLLSTGNPFFSNGIDFVDCLLPTGDLLFDTMSQLGSQWPYRVWNCDDSTGNSFIRFQEVAGHMYNLRHSKQAGRVGGAQDEAGNIFGWEMKAATTSFSNQWASWWRPAGPSVPLIAYIDGSKTGSSRTAEVQVATPYASDNSNLWLEVSSLDSTTSPKGTLHTTRTADFLAAGTSLTTSTEDWTALASARANSHVYAVGDMYKAASNTGRLFVCVTGGTSASSEPGAVATAVDGTSFTDGTATFIAVFRYKLSLSFTPQRAGIVRAWVRRVFTSTMCTGNDRTLIDPLVKIS